MIAYNYRQMIFYAKAHAFSLLTHVSNTTTMVWSTCCYIKGPIIVNITGTPWIVPHLIPIESMYSLYFPTCDLFFW